MYAAVVRSFDHAPRYESFDDPIAKGENEIVVDVLAAGLHPRVRAGASGSHYTSTQELPLIPGVDGVGRLPDGKLVYFVAPDTALGTMAEQAVIDYRQSVPLPDGVDPVMVAAAMNPAMSSWLALRKRITFEAGKRVLVLGATGSAGQMAIQIAKRLGASQVIAAGRDADLLNTLSNLGADSVVSMAGDPEEMATQVGEAAADVDVVIDYVWGQPAELIMPALLMRRSERDRAIDWIHIGSMAGTTIALRSELLRAANFRILGSGQGSISTADIVAELPALVAELAAGRLTVNAKAVPLSAVEATWNVPAPRSQRIVFTPTAAVTR
ncbi:MAG: zinc-binding alcohol dehydrogenase family protein [Anaerolineae bacterium]|nr:zinc-binding alcohol dehydrogenase family protein [Anaerolineae bacterium]